MCPQSVERSSNERLDVIRQSPRQASVDEVEWLCGEIDLLRSERNHARAERDRLRAALEKVIEERGRLTPSVAVALARKALAGAADETSEQRK